MEKGGERKGPGRRRMTNTQKLDLVVRMQRRARIRRILWFVVFALLAGAVLIYAQYRHAAEATGLAGSL